MQAAEEKVMESKGSYQAWLDSKKDYLGDKKKKEAKERAKKQKEEESKFEKSKDAEMVST